jgi:hypothetical protein
LELLCLRIDDKSQPVPPLGRPELTFCETEECAKECEELDDYHNEPKAGSVEPVSSEAIVQAREGHAARPKFLGNLLGDERVSVACFQSPKAHRPIVKVGRLYHKAEVCPKPWVDFGVVVARLEVPGQEKTLGAEKSQNLPQRVILERVRL